MPWRTPATACAALVAVHAALLACAAVGNSVTFDEYAHLPAGAAYWKYGDFSIYNLSPPLPRLWAALPALLAGAKVPPSSEVAVFQPRSRHWEFGERFLRANFAVYHRLFVLGRLGLIPISCLGAWIVYRWARDLYGTAAGLASCTLYAFCPNVLAHASLIGTDAPAAVAFVAAAWLWWRFCRGPSRRGWALAAMTVGLAHLCKFTALLLWPALLLMALWLGFGDRRWRARLLGLMAMAVFVLLLVNVAYGLRGSGERLGSYAFESDWAKRLSAALPAWLPVPLPEDFVQGFDAQKFETEGRYSGFLLGETYRGSRWYFYPVVLGVKLPLPAWLLMALALASLFPVGPLYRAPRLLEGAPLVALLVFALGLIGLTQVNIGVRYILPIFPLAHVMIGRLWSRPEESRPDRPWVSRALLAPLALLAVATLSSAPNFLSFINTAAGGPQAGWRLVTDSNFDWGQSLLSLRRWMDVQGVERVHLAYFGRVDPGVYGIHYTPLNQVGHEAYVAVSSYYLVGMAHRMPTAQGMTAMTGIPFYRQLQQQKPVARVGDTIFIFTREAFRNAALQARR